VETTDPTAAGTSDCIELRGLRVLARCGTLPDEIAHDQPLEIDIDLLCDLRAAVDSDSLADTVDYGRVCATVEEAATASRAALLEHLAGRIAARVLDIDPRVEGVIVAVRKLRPPVPHHLATAGVRIERHR
jgi:7,8-dihydroneopterin aldolase/epimerase/oxygenase